MEVLMDDFSIHGGTFDLCLEIYPRYSVYARKSILFSIGKNATLWFRKGRYWAKLSLTEASRYTRLRLRLLSRCPLLLR